MENLKSHPVPNHWSNLKSGHSPHQAERSQVPVPFLQTTFDVVGHGFDPVLTEAARVKRGKTPKIQREVYRWKNRGSHFWEWSSKPHLRHQWLVRSSCPKFVRTFLKKPIFQPLPMFIAWIVV